MEYFKTYTGSENVSIVNALAAIGADSTYSYRKQIAAANGIADYSGTSAQNLKMLSLLKDGKLIKPGSDNQTADAEPTTKSNRRRWLAGCAIAAIIGGLLYFGSKDEKKPAKAATKKRKPAKEKSKKGKK